MERQAASRMIQYVFMILAVSLMLQVFSWFIERTRIKLTHLGSGTMVADGSEQRVFALERSEPFKLEGYIDLSKMQTGDEVIIRQYVRLKPGGELKKYWEDTYRGIQDNPIIYITPKPSLYGVLVTLQQTAGKYITYDWEFYMSITG